MSYLIAEQHLNFIEDSARHLELVIAMCKAQPTPAVVIEPAQMAFLLQAVVGPLQAIADAAVWHEAGGSAVVTPLHPPALHAQPARRQAALQGRAA